MNDEGIVAVATRSDVDRAARCNGLYHMSSGLVGREDDGVALAYGSACSFEPGPELVSEPSKKRRIEFERERPRSQRRRACCRERANVEKLAILVLRRHVVLAREDCYRRSGSRLFDDDLVKSRFRCHNGPLSE